MFFHALTFAGSQGNCLNTMPIDKKIICCDSITDSCHNSQFSVRTDLEKSLNSTLVLENSWNLKKVPFVLEFCKIILENMS